MEQVTDAWHLPRLVPPITLPAAATNYVTGHHKNTYVGLSFKWTIINLRAKSNNVDCRRAEVAHGYVKSY